jgi:ABC-type multidrug transport system fused ATPase/permease subunit
VHRLQKSTLLDIIVGYKKLSCGTIAFAFGADDCRVSTVAEKVSAIPAQDNAAIWTETLRYNVLYEARSGVDTFQRHFADTTAPLPSDDAIQQILKVLQWAPTKCNSSLFAATAVDPLDVVLEPSRMSSGEKQRVLLARALLSGKPVLVMDEGTSALSPNVEADVWALLRKTFQTIILVSLAHHFRDMQRADYLVGMQDGMAQEAGTRDVLLPQSHSLLRHCFRVVDNVSTCRLLRA